MGRAEIQGDTQRPADDKYTNEWTDSLVMSAMSACYVSVSCIDCDYIVLLYLLV